MEKDREDPLPSVETFDKMLVEKGPEAYVAKLVEVYGRHVRRGGPKAERLFRQVRVGYIGFKDKNLYAIYVREMLKIMPEETRAAVRMQVDRELQSTKRRVEEDPSQREGKDRPGLLRRIWQELFGSKPAK